ncbi:Glycine cleavage system H protein [Mycoplasmopsis bovis 8790]|nr:Glycine cleavage system H protein [Mycoplasmopsis bovis 8790]
MKKLIGKFTLEYLDDKNEYVLRLTPDAQDELISIKELKILVKENCVYGTDELFMITYTAKEEKEFKMPIKASIIKINDSIFAKPSLITSVYDDENWIATLKDINKEEYDKLEEFAMWDRYQSLIS